MSQQFHESKIEQICKQAQGVDFSTKKLSNVLRDQKKKC
jgi:hypothetical protein